MSLRPNRVCIFILPVSNHCDIGSTCMLSVMSVVIQSVLLSVITTVVLHNHFPHFGFPVLPIKPRVPNCCSRSRATWTDWTGGVIMANILVGWARPGTAMTWTMKWTGHDFRNNKTDWWPQTKKPYVSWHLLINCCEVMKLSPSGMFDIESRSVLLYGNGLRPPREGETE